MKSIAIIPARSGSKELIDKNIKLLCGKPLLAYTIEAAIKSNCFDEVMVSTDSSEYATIAKEFGANVPFLRSKKTASDHASSWDAVLEVISSYKESGKEFSQICLLQPTSPMRDALDIRAAFKKMDKLDARAIVSICEMEHSFSLCNKVGSNDSLDNFISRFSNKRRQDVKKYYRLNGAIYLVKLDFLYEDTFLYRKGCYGLIMEQSHSIDIDTELDLLIAKTILENQQRQEK